MGEFVFLRTYARWLPEKERRETWAETVRRVVEYSFSLHLNPYNQKQDLVSEAEKLFDLIYNLKVFPAGRSLWIGGTKAAEKYPLANFNCSFRVVDGLDAFTEVFYLLMLGCGTGFRVLPSDVDKIPKLSNTNKLTHGNYHYRGNMSDDETSWAVTGSIRNSYKIIRVGDSKEGWVDALREYFIALVKGIDVHIEYDNVRPRGALLHTFGGRASGPEGLQEMFENIHKVICATDGKLKPIDALDIMNIIAYNVVAGGVRRSSQIALFDINDQDILNAKVDLYTPGSKNYGKNWRAMSNNSIYFTKKPTKAQLKDIFTRIQHNGEPGFVNAVAANKRRPNFEGINPCAEILLDNQGVCNLTEVNLNAFVKPHELDYGANLYFILDRSGLEEAIRHAVRMGLRMTNLTLELPAWDKVQKRDRLAGVSLTGVMDAFDKLHMDGDLQEELLKDLNDTANRYATEYAKQMRIPQPLLVTTVKPSGTISQLPTVSSGVHRSFAPNFIRRIRITATDPLAKVVKALNYPIFPETGMGPNRAEFLKLNWQEQEKILATANTWVVEFPVETDATTEASGEPAKFQFRRYLKFQRNWTDHNTSISIYFTEEEIDDIIREILMSWDEYIAVSFLPTDSHTYNLMPYEEITEQEFIQRRDDILPGNLNELLTYLEKIELVDNELDPNCATGICPPR